MKPITKKSAPSPATHPSKTPVPTTAVDPGEAAHQRLQARLVSIPAERVVQPRTDVRAAATFVLSDTASRLKDPAFVARLYQLAAVGFDRTAVDDLIPAAQAALWAQTQLAIGSASEATPRLDATLVAQATALRGDMLDLCDYHFKGDTDLERQLADIHAGSGYLDLAADLTRLAALYREHHQTLAQDLRFYDAADAQEAVTLAQRITSELRQQPSRTLAARELAWRSWALLQALYEEVARGGRFLLHYQGGAAAFPSLNSVGRAAPRRPRPKPDATEPQNRPAAGS